MFSVAAASAQEKEKKESRDLRGKEDSARLNTKGHEMRRHSDTGQKKIENKNYRDTFNEHNKNKGGYFKAKGSDLPKDSVANPNTRVYYEKKPSSPSRTKPQSGNPHSNKGKDKKKP